ncbi:DUF4397 domain-containing protein [Halomarina ordinaria]|uniref:DUF4397 domain-containing protein n=1 Tax=Halomarina ordinaria TaxID=3033939 RepID=A0ABD5U9N5_9EURY|nr:DUF4397 domain-containing protein [Halomarina sp. PSRA2]
MTDTDRRTVLKLLGVAGAASALGGVGFVSANEHESNETANETDGEEMVPGAAGGLATGGVRVGHLSPDTPPVDVYVGVDAEFDPADTSPALAGLEYGTFAPGATGRYFEVPEGTYALKVTPAGDPETVAIDVPEFEVVEGQDATVLAVGELDPESDEPALEPLVITDTEGEDLPDPSAGEAAIRFVHASPDAGAVDIAVADRTVAEDVEFGGVSDYVPSEDCTQVLQVIAGGVPALVLQAYLPGGTKSTAYVVGSVSPDGGGDDSANATTATNETANDTTGNETDAADTGSLATEDQPLGAVATIDAVAPLDVTPIDLGGEAPADDEDEVADDNVTDDNATDDANETVGNATANETADNATVNETVDNATANETNDTGY